MIATMFLALAAATPSSEAQQLGRKLADTGLLASILPMMKQKEVEEIVGNAKDLSDAERQLYGRPRTGFTKKDANGC